MAAGLLVIVPFCYVFMPQASEFTPTFPPSERGGLRRLGADRRVAAAIAWPAVALSFVPGMLIVGVYAIVPLVIGR